MDSAADPLSPYAISGDKAKLKAYCKLGKLQEEMEKAEEEEVRMAS